MQLLAVFGDVQIVLFITAARYAIGYLYSNYGGNADSSACRTGLLLAFLVTYAVLMLAIVLFGVVVWGTGARQYLPVILAPSLSIFSSFVAAYLAIAIESFWIDTVNEAQYDTFLALLEIVLASCSVVSCIRVASQAFMASDRCRMIWAFSFGVAAILFRDTVFNVVFLVLFITTEVVRAAVIYVGDKTQRATMDPTRTRPFRTVELVTGAVQVSLLFLFFFASVATEHNILRFVAPDRILQDLHASNMTYLEYLREQVPSMAAALSRYTGSTHVSTGFVVVLWVVFLSVAVPEFYAATSSPAPVPKSRSA